MAKLILKKLLGNGLKIGDHVVRLEKTVLWSELGGVGAFRAGTEGIREVSGISLALGLDMLGLGIWATLNLTVNTLKVHC